MIVVSDTSPITALLQIGLVDLLPKLYQEVVIPEAVDRELRRAHPTIPEFIRVAKVRNQEQVAILGAGLDRGEAEAIVLMKEGAGDLLLIDERRGRRVAQREGVAHIGLLGVLVECKRSVFIRSLREVIDSLEQVAGFRLAPSLKARALAEVGE
jgi:uncharacterized protein